MTLMKIKLIFIIIKKINDFIVKILSLFLFLLILESFFKIELILKELIFVFKLKLTIRLFLFFIKDLISSRLNQTVYFNS